MPPQTVVPQHESISVTFPEGQVPAGHVPASVNDTYPSISQLAQTVPQQDKDELAPTLAWAQVPVGHVPPEPGVR